MRTMSEREAPAGWAASKSLSLKMSIPENSLQYTVWLNGASGRL